MDTGRNAAALMFSNTGTVVTRRFISLNAFSCSSVQLNSVSCRVRRHIGSMWSARRGRNFDKSVKPLHAFNVFWSRHLEDGFGFVSVYLDPLFGKEVTHKWYFSNPQFQFVLVEGNSTLSASE